LWPAGCNYRLSDLFFITNPAAQFLRSVSPNSFDLIFDTVIVLHSVSPSFGLAGRNSANPQRASRAGYQRSTFVAGPQESQENVATVGELQVVRDSSACFGEHTRTAIYLTSPRKPSPPAKGHLIRSPAVAQRAALNPQSQKWIWRQTAPCHRAHRPRSASNCPKRIRLSRRRRGYIFTS